MLKKKVLWETSERNIVTKGGGAYVGTTKTDEDAKVMALAPVLWNMLIALGNEEINKKLKQLNEDA